MNQITDAQVQAAYAECLLVRSGEKQFSDAVETLENNYEMNLGSARDFLNNFKHLMNGEAYNRTLNGYATRYFLENIYSDFGKDALIIALEAVNGHIKYYESLKRGKLRNIRKIHDSFLNHIDDEPLEHNRDFELLVKKSMADDTQIRQLRLSKAEIIPQIVSSIIKVYKRNPDVVAEVLIRASGVCENCNQPAPFIRAKDGTPYLEVHHKIRLASGGEDTIANAIAVCPNCHRELHFGSIAHN